MNLRLTPPSRLAQPAVEQIHGFAVEDRFRSLEDQTSQSTRAFIHAEQEFCERYLARWHSLRSSVEGRVRELLRDEAVELPISDRRGGLLYEKRARDDEQKSIYHRNRPGIETRIVCGGALGRDKHTSLSLLRVSPDGRFLAFALRSGGEDVQEIGIFDLFEQSPLPDKLRRGLFRGLVFDQAGEGFFYVLDESEKDHESRHTVRHHAFGTDQRNDEVVFSCGSDRATRLRLLESEDGSALGYTISSLSSQSQCRFFIHRFPLGHAPDEIPIPAYAMVSPRFGAFGIMAATTWCAPRGRIVSIHYEDSDPAKWIELIPQSEHRIHAFEIAGEEIIVHYSDGPRMRTSICSSDGLLRKQISYPDQGSVTLGHVDQFNHHLFYSLDDIISGRTVYALDLDSGQSHEWWTSAGLKWRVSPAIERHSYLTQDGMRVPLTIVRPAAVKGSRPTVLTVYGSRGAYDSPRSSVVLTVLVEAGFNYATAHLGAANERDQARGHLEGSVNAAIAAGQWLIENHYTTAAQLGLAGQSHGALLALCAMIQQPAIFRAILALGPIADLTRFHLFGVARWFVQEFGSPEDPEEFQMLLKLSPYHRIERGVQYPAVLIISGDLDKRCDAMHARKMIAALRDSGSNNPIVLDYNEHRGHKPGLPVEERIRSLTDRLTFLIAELTEQNRVE